jgi:hypothetical protein
MSNFIDKIKKFFNPFSVLEEQKEIEQFIKQKIEELEEEEKAEAKKKAVKKTAAKKTAKKAPAKKTATKKK